MIPPIHIPKFHKFAIEQGALIKQLPEFIKLHVKMVIDVKADGHCRYRVVAHALGRGEESYMEIRKQLHAEINKQREFYCKENTFAKIDQTLASIYPTPSEPVGTKHWMSMPSMGEAMANAFESPVFYFSPSHSQSCFPHFCWPKESPAIYIVFLPKTHHFVYLMIMKGPYEFPTPRYLNNWEKSANKEALGPNYTPQTSRRPTIERNVTFNKPQISDHVIYASNFNLCENDKIS
ncbi:hypothetical protein VP01_2328g2 [Puccinia sorghi]|uniref:OTU domain-containing protein n=1 Tax=Puccinia sorghi TaxID=27349 RepID=A0A0L6V882_9BASI|nr:hypothetical protein VP01_2328g2 [Puccinia sorghi]